MCNYYNACRQNSFFTGKNIFESSSVALVSTDGQSGISISVSKSTASGASTDDKLDTDHPI